MSSSFVDVVIDDRLRDRVAIVAGGARGIGAATVERLAADGAHVARAPQVHMAKRRFTSMTDATAARIGVKVDDYQARVAADTPLGRIGLPRDVAGQSGFS